MPSTMRPITFSTLPDFARHSETQRDCPGPPVRGVAQVARWPAGVPFANAPDMPFCAEVWSATVVVRSRCSALPAMRPIAESACLDDVARIVILHACHRLFGEPWFG